MKPYSPRHSFKRSPVCTQIIIYALLLTECFIFSFVIQLHVVDQGLRIALSACFYLTFLVFVIAGVKSSLEDVSDRLLILRGQDEMMKYIEQRDCLYCQLCKGVVKDSSRHCKVCQVCVEGFDHHCIWLNTCIGSKNYFSFFILVVSLTVNLLTYLIALLLTSMHADWSNFLPAMIVAWSIGVIVLIKQILLVTLLAFHLFLFKIGKTTYEYLTHKEGSRKVAPVVFSNERNNSLEQIRTEQNKNNTTVISEGLQDNRNEQQSDQTHLPFIFAVSHFNVDQKENEDKENDVKMNENKKMEEEHQRQSHKTKEPCQREQMEIQIRDVSEKDTEGDHQIRRNKSLDYIFGKFQIQTPTNYQSFVQPRRPKAIGFKKSLKQFALTLKIQS